MIECTRDSVIPIDERVIRRVTDDVTLDPDYVHNLPSFHGGTPLDQYFFDASGVVRRIGWFVALIDERSELAPPFQTGTYYSDIDTRVDDRAIPAILNDEVCPFHFGNRILPMAALYTDDQIPTSLRLHTLDWLPSDSLCFDMATWPHAIVYCNAETAVEQALKWDDDRTNTYEFTYDFLVPVASSFQQFASQLSRSP